MCDGVICVMVHHYSECVVNKILYYEQRRRHCVVAKCLERYVVVLDVIGFIAGPKPIYTNYLYLHNFEIGFQYPFPTVYGSVQVKHEIPVR